MRYIVASKDIIFSLNDKYSRKKNKKHRPNSIERGNSQSKKKIIIFLMNYLKLEHLKLYLVFSVISCPRIFTVKCKKLRITWED